MVCLLDTFTACEVASCGRIDNYICIISIIVTRLLSVVLVTCIEEFGVLGER